MNGTIAIDFLPAIDSVYTEEQRVKVRKAALEEVWNVGANIIVGDQYGKYNGAQGIDPNVTQPSGMFLPFTHLYTRRYNKRELTFVTFPYWQEGNNQSIHKVNLNNSEQKKLYDIFKKLDEDEFDVITVMINRKEGIITLEVEMKDDTIDKREYWKEYLSNSDVDIDGKVLLFAPRSYEDYDVPMLPPIGQSQSPIY